MYIQHRSVFANTERQFQIGNADCSRLTAVFQITCPASENSPATAQNLIDFEKSNFQIRKIFLNFIIWEGIYDEKLLTDFEKYSVSLKNIMHTRNEKD